MRLRVTLFGESILRKSGRTVESFDPDLVRLRDDMIETMYAEEGIGLAAQQVGEAIQLCVVDVNFGEGPPEFAYTLDGKVPPLNLIMPLTLINPRIRVLDCGNELAEEGCLSFPKFRAMIDRPIAIEVDYQDIRGASHRLVCDGILARCIQHEVDHLHGILFIDRTSEDERRRVDSELRRLRKAFRARMTESKGEQP